PRPELHLGFGRGRGTHGPQPDRTGGQTPHRAAPDAARHADPGRSRPHGGRFGPAPGDVRLAAGVAAAQRGRRARGRWGSGGPGHRRFCGGRRGPARLAGGRRGPGPGPGSRGTDAAVPAGGWSAPMRIHRLHLRHFRGVTDREVTFPSSGVVILQGQNEVGKSTMIEAFDLLLDKADSSKAAAVRAVQPAGQDVGPEVEAESSTGDYRFTFTQQWLRSPRTELHLSAPQRRHLTGGQAHDEVRRILEETLDTALFKALRVLQTGARAPVDLSDSAALSAALDRSAGSAGHDDQGEALLQRVDQEYARYFTPTGRPTGELARIEQDKRTREEASPAAEQGLAQLQQDVDLHARLTAELADIDRSRAEATQRAEADEKAWQQVQQLREQLAEADRSVQLHR